MIMLIKRVRISSSNRGKKDDSVSASKIELCKDTSRPATRQMVK